MPAALWAGRTVFGLGDTLCSAGAPSTPACSATTTAGVSVTSAAIDDGTFDVLVDDHVVLYE